MIIPNDTGHPWRLNKFVEYQNKVPPVHPLVVTEYAYRKNLGPDDCVVLSWLTSMTYNEITTLLLFEELDWRRISKGDIEAYWAKEKPRLLFNSARKHVKNADWFVPLLGAFLETVKGKPEAWVKSLVTEDPVESYERVFEAATKIRYTGRFAADLFLEMLIAFSKRDILNFSFQAPSVLDWKNCLNLTSGMFNILYMDEEADEYDRTGRVPEEHLETLNKGIKMVQEAIQKRYPDQDVDIPLVIGKICSFRNLFKSARYGGFHHDRQLENLRRYEKARPEKQALWEEIYKIRSKIFDKSLLGEVGGWNGVRKERKKLWVTKGLTGVEEIPDPPELGLLGRIRKENSNLSSETVKPTIDVTVPISRDMLKKILEKEASVDLNIRLSILVDNPLEDPVQTEVQEEPDNNQETQINDQDGENNLSPDLSKEEFSPQSVSEENDDLMEFLKRYGIVPAGEEAGEADTILSKEADPILSQEFVQECENKTGETEEEDMRSPIKTDVNPRFMIVAPYDYSTRNRVDKTYPERIRKAWKNGEIDFCYFPIEPFHYREVKRHATRMAVDACLENNIPMSMETRKVVPSWCIEALSRNKYSDIRIQLNTLNEKNWKLQYPEADKPKELVDSIINCFNGGAYTILKVAPIIPGILEPFEVFQTIDAVKNWVESVEVLFASFDDLGFAKAIELQASVKDFYHKIEDRWYVNGKYRADFLRKLEDYTKGWKIKLKVLNEITVDKDNNVKLLNFRG